MTGRTGRRKQRTITGVFLRYICVFGGGALLWLLLLAGILMALVGMGAVLPANYAEIYLKENMSVFQESPEITEEMIPVECTYGVYEQDGKWLYGTFSGEDRKDAWEHYEEKYIYAGMRRYYRFIERDVGEVCIMNYQLRTQFRSPLLRKYLPRVEVLLPIVYLVLFLLHTMVVSRRFGTYMQDRLEVLNEVTGAIRNRDLEFEKKHSELKEVEEVLDSLYQMQEALRASLFRQWDLEKSKEEQIAALAHDIKTPLTVIRGNAELLEEGELGEAEREYNRDIRQSAAIMEEYLEMLHGILLEKEGHPQVGEEEIREKRIPCETLVDRLEEQARLLASARQCPIVLDRTKTQGNVPCDESQIVRAFQNIVSNALDHNPAGRELRITFSERMEKGRKYLAAVVMDEGKGFSAEDLRHATERFYRGDKSRSSRIHYGIGLHTAAEFAQAQGGYVTVENRENGGGKVTLSLRIME